MRREKTWRVGRQFIRVHTFGASVHGHTRHKSNYTFINGHNSDNNNNRNDESRNWRRRQTNELQKYENRLRSVTCCFYYNPKTYLYIYINRFFDIKNRPKIVFVLHHAHLRLAHFPSRTPNDTAGKTRNPFMSNQIKLITERGTEKNAIPTGAGEGGYS